MGGIIGRALGGNFGFLGGLFIIILAIIVIYLKSKKDQKTKRKEYQNQIFERYISTKNMHNIKDTPNPKINIQDSHGYTPLMMATLNGKTEDVQKLIMEGADVNLKNDIGLSALDLAKQFGHKKIEETLIKCLQK